MNALDDLFGTPRAPDFAVDWQALDERFVWIRAMRGVEQDAIWHAEGDVWIHTKLVCEALAAMAAWRALEEGARRICWLGALFHDIAKPYSTALEEGRIRSPRHSPRGAIHARRLLWEAGLPPADRESVCGIVRHHQLPLHGVSATDAEHRTSVASMRCRLRDLAIVAEADIRGRVCDDQADKLESIELFAEYARELGCLDAPRPFPSDRTRLAFFHERKPATAALHDDARCTVTILSGLPASGKTAWRSASALPAVSLDDLRVELGVHPDADQGRVRQLAIERARALLREGRDLCWDATNLDVARRRPIVETCLDYRARVVILAMERSSEALWEANARRPRPVPRPVLESMLARWVPPDATEAHHVDRVIAASD